MSSKTVQEKQSQIFDSKKFKPAFSLQDTEEGKLKKIITSRYQQNAFLSKGRNYKSIRKITYYCLSFFLQVLIFVSHLSQTNF